MPDLTETEHGYKTSIYKMLSISFPRTTVIQTIQNFLERKTNHTVAA